MNKTLPIVFALLLAPPPGHAQMVSFLTSQWWDRGSQMCKYDNGTVLNMGIKLCPLSIPA